MSSKISCDCGICEYLEDNSPGDIRVRPRTTGNKKSSKASRTQNFSPYSGYWSNATQKNVLLYWNLWLSMLNSQERREQVLPLCLRSNKFVPLGCGSLPVVPEHRREGATWSTSHAELKLRLCENINTAKYIWEEPAYLGLYSSWFSSEFISNYWWRMKFCLEKKFSYTSL